MDLSSFTVEKKKYWDIELGSENKPYPKWKDSIDSVLRESVKLHTVSDVEYGAFLSGGIDSTLMVKYLTETLQRPIKTFTIGFKNSKIDETGWAEQVAKKYGTDHTTISLEANALELLPKIVANNGEPFGDFSSVPTYYLSMAASEHVKMIISGDGADELFAGYGHYFKWKEKVEQDKIYFRNSFIEFLYPFANRILPNRYPLLKKGTDLLETYLPYRSRMNKKFREELWRDEYRNVWDSEDLQVVNWGESFYQNPTDKRSQFYDIKVFLPDDILFKVDNMSMMNLFCG